MLAVKIKDCSFHYYNKRITCNIYVCHAYVTVMTSLAKLMIIFLNCIHSDEPAPEPQRHNKQTSLGRINEWHDTDWQSMIVKMSGWD